MFCKLQIFLQTNLELFSWLLQLLCFSALKFLAVLDSWNIFVFIWFFHPCSVYCFIKASLDILVFVWLEQPLFRRNFFFPYLRSWTSCRLNLTFLKLCYLEYCTISNVLFGPLRVRDSRMQLHIDTSHCFFSLFCKLS